MASSEIEAVVYERRERQLHHQRRAAWIGGVLPRRREFPANTVKSAAANEVLRVNLVDVQQGDGAVDAGWQGSVHGRRRKLMFARYLAGRFHGADLQAERRGVLVVLHGDADHFAGLPKIRESETHPQKQKRLFIRPQRVYHNGIVKRPSTRNKKSVPDRELLGATTKTDAGLFLPDSSPTSLRLLTRR